LRALALAPLLGSCLNSFAQTIISAKDHIPSRSDCRIFPLASLNRPARARGLFARYAGWSMVAKVMPHFRATVKGTATFYDGTTALAIKSLSGGVAKFTTSTRVKGTHMIRATYNGNVSFLGSSASLTETVN
jgi:hypothetical protein